MKEFQMIDLMFDIADWLHEHYRVAGLLIVMCGIFIPLVVRWMFPNDDQLDCGMVLLMIPFGIGVMRSKTNPFI